MSTDKPACYLNLKVHVSVRTTETLEGGTESYLVVTKVEELGAIATADNCLDLTLIYDEEHTDHDDLVNRTVVKMIDDLSQVVNAR